jgi:hypothetical protein
MSDIGGGHLIEATFKADGGVDSQIILTSTV